MNRTKKLARKLVAMVLNHFDANTNTTGTSTLSAENKTYYEKRLLENAKVKLMHEKFGDTYPIPKGGGKTIEWRKFTKLAKATTALTEGVTPNGTALTVTNQTATVSQYGNYVSISDMLELSAIDNTIVETSKLIGTNGGETLDTITKNILNAGTNVIYAPKLSGTTETAVSARTGLDTTATLTPDLVFQAAAFLKAMGADTIDGSFVGLIHPYVAYDLMKSSAWIEAHKYARPENIEDGEIGKIGNVRFYDISEAKVWKDSTCPTVSEANIGVFSTLILGAHAYGKTDIEGGGMQIIIKQKGSAGTADPLDQRSTIGWKATHAAKILAQEYMVRIESCSSKYSSSVSAN